MLSLDVQQREQLIQTAIQATSRAYSPYTKFRVGAALLCRDGTVIGGCDVENASLSTTICAERSAIARAVSEGKKQSGYGKDFVAIAVTGGVRGYITPCGICRQVLREFLSLDAPVLLVPVGYPNKPDESEIDRGKEVQATVAEDWVMEVPFGRLLPMSFGPDDLGKSSVDIGK